MTSKSLRNHGMSLAPWVLLNSLRVSASPPIKTVLVFGPSVTVTLAPTFTRVWPLPRLELTSFCSKISASSTPVCPPTSTAPSTVTRLALLCHGATMLVADLSRPPLWEREWMLARISTPSHLRSSPNGTRLVVKFFPDLPDAEPPKLLSSSLEQLQNLILFSKLNT